MYELANITINPERHFDSECELILGVNLLPEENIDFKMNPIDSEGYPITMLTIQT
jgi:hypothetical protein